jgi:hypothetical protein
MAYPVIDAPYGLKPINLIGGQVFAGSTRMMEIASGYATNIFYGDLVKRVSGGTIEKDTGTTTATPSGVFLGVSFTNSSTGQVQQQQFYPASQAIKSGTKIFAVVADDPDKLIRCLFASLMWFGKPKLLPITSLKLLSKSMRLCISTTIQLAYKEHKSWLFHAHNY